MHFLIPFLLCVLFSAAVPAEPSQPAIEIEAGKQITFGNGRPITFAATGDPEIADVYADAELFNSGYLIIKAKGAGTTSLLVWYGKPGKKGPPDVNVEVLVTAATGVKRRGVEQLGDTGLQVSEAGDQAQLSGSATSLQAHAQARQVLGGGKKDAAVPDMSELGFNPQVQIDIKIVEVSRTKMKKAGIFLGKNSPNTTLAISTPGNLSGVESNAAGGFDLLSAANFLPQAQAFNFVYANAKEGILGIISALENNGFAYTLAEPTLVTVSGQSANFLAGGEFPVPVRAGGVLESGISVTFKQFGVRLSVTPTVLDNERIALKVAPEVSELDFSNVIETGGAEVPALNVRRTDTTIMMGDGESFIISGLVSQNSLAGVDKLPWLGDIPILGAFFRSTEIERTDKELIMVVSPHLVRPIAKGTPLPPLPGDAYRRYDPSFFRAFFLETGDFGVKEPAYSGFSN